MKNLMWTRRRGWMWKILHSLRQARKEKFIFIHILITTNKEMKMKRRRISRNAISFVRWQPGKSGFGLDVSRVLFPVSHFNFRWNVKASFV